MFFVCNTQDIETPEATTPSNPTPPVKKSGNFFSIFGKIVLVLLVLGGLTYGGYYLGSSKKNENVSPTPTPPAMQVTTEPNQITIVPAKPSTKTVKGGLTDGSTSFKPYSVDIPEGWAEKVEKTDITHKLTVSKSGYSIEIYQAPLGGNGCIYKGDPPSDFTQTFNNFVAINGNSAQFRRSWNTDGQYTICQKHPSENSYGSITTFGAIGAKAPVPQDSAIMTELDGIIASLKTQ